MRTDNFSEYSPTVVKQLRAIERAQIAVRQAQDDLDSAVRAARNNGLTWTQIGLVLDTTRQAAQMRFRNIGENRPLA